jgi:RNA polymerase sigma-B factor
LLVRWRKGGDRRARTQLIERMLPLVRHVARRYRDSSEQQEDLVQSGTEGLIKAVDDFDVEREGSFTSYAVPKIEGEIKHHLRDNTWGVHVPSILRERTVRIAAASARLASRYGRPPRPGELAEEAGVNESEAQEALLAREGYCAESLQASRAEGMSLAETIPAPAGDLERSDDRLVLSESMRTLPVRERKVLALRFWGDLNQREIAVLVGLSQIQVSRLQRRAFERLREALRKGGEGGPTLDA